MRSLLKGKKYRWLVTGAAGFIGSNLVEALLSEGQEVLGLDDFSTGRRENLKEVELNQAKNWNNFALIEGSIEDRKLLNDSMVNVDFVLHHAAIASVPYSIENPDAFHCVNVTGFLNVLQAARQQKVRRVVYASSSAVYGDEVAQPAQENKTGFLLSPYALSKKVNEEYAQTFETCYGLSSVGLRYFNVFGPRQDPRGAYAAVIPIWMDSLLMGRQIQIYGDGETTRDFCYVDDVIHANLQAALVDLSGHRNRVFNVAAAQKTSLNELYRLMCEILVRAKANTSTNPPQYRDFRSGDVRHSMADIRLAQSHLGFSSGVTLRDGIESYLKWCQKQIVAKGSLS